AHREGDVAPAFPDLGRRLGATTCSMSGYRSRYWPGKSARKPAAKIGAAAKGKADKPKTK
ncbi:hypothetical protein ABTB72_19245, partial [Acinetobacter baumannii]